MNAWDLLTVEAQEKIDNTHLIRIKGGTALYESACCTRNEQVLLSRLKPLNNGRIHQVNRYIPWNTEVELVPIKVPIALVSHYETGTQVVKAFYSEEDAERFIAQQAKIIEGYNFSVWQQGKRWVAWNTKEDRQESMYWIGTANKEDVLDLF